MIYNILIHIIYISIKYNIKTFNSCRQRGPQCQRLLRQVGKTSLQIFKTWTIFNLQHVSWSSHCRLGSMRRIPLYKKFKESATTTTTGNQGMMLCQITPNTSPTQRSGKKEWQASVRLPRAASKNLYSSVRRNTKEGMSVEKNITNQWYICWNKVSWCIYLAHFLMVYMFHTGIPGWAVPLSFPQGKHSQR